MDEQLGDTFNCQRVGGQPPIRLGELYDGSYVVLIHDQVLKLANVTEAAQLVTALRAFIKKDE